MTNTNQATIATSDAFNMFVGTRQQIDAAIEDIKRGLAEYPDRYATKKITWANVGDMQHTLAVLTYEADRLLGRGEFA